MYNILQICKIVKGKLLQNAANTTIKQLFIDSRNIIFPESALFIALPSTNRNGHEFIQNAYEKGVRNFLVAEKISIKKYADANVILTSNTLAALQKLATHHRSQFQIETIGITGSNGKTIVKEWLNQLLQANFNIVRSPKSYNSQIGVPLSVWLMHAKNNLAIFEAGISQPNEMQQLQAIIQPTVGILTNIGTAHDEGFKNDKAKKIAEKIKLFSSCKTIIYNNDIPTIKNAIESTYPTTEKITWGREKGSTLQVKKQIVKNNSCSIQLQFRKQNHTFQLPFSDAASIENAMHCISYLLYKRYSEKQINIRLQQLQPVALRLEQKAGTNNNLLINDSYSNDLSSLSIALDTLQQWSGTKKQIVVLSDLEQSGIAESTLYTKVATLLQEYKIEQFIGIGEKLFEIQKKFNFCKKNYFFTTTQEAKDFFQETVFENKAILIKGARKYELENMVNALEEKVHQTVLEVDLTKLLENIKKHQALVKPSTKIMAIVKAYGYGNGPVPIAHTLQKAGVQYLAVAYTDEGVALRKAGIHLPIMVMNVEPQTYDALVQHNLEPELFSLTTLIDFKKYAQRNALSNYPIHIKLDTGMHRLGFEANDISSLCEQLHHQNLVQVQSIFSHFVGSDAAQFDTFTANQNSLFVKMANHIENSIGYTTIKHIANTGAIQRNKNLQHQMVRLGIGMYGVTSNTKLKLQQVATLKATIAQIKTVQKNETVGYSRNGKLKKTSTIATIRIGYADGYKRNLGNGNAYVLVNGQKAPTIGNVCMDMTMIDVTHIPNVQEGNYVTLFGDNPTIEQVATWNNTIAYEILTSVNERVKRVYTT